MLGSDRFRYVQMSFGSAIRTRLKAIDLELATVPGAQKPVVFNGGSGGFLQVAILNREGHGDQDRVRLGGVGLVLVVALGHHLL